MVQQDARWTVTEGAARQPPPHTRRTHVRLIVRLAQDRDDVVRRRVHYGVSLSRVCVVVAFHLARLISAVLSILRFWAGSHRFLRVGSCLQPFAASSTGFSTSLEGCLWWCKPPASPRAERHRSKRHAHHGFACRLTRVRRVRSERVRWPRCAVGGHISHIIDTRSGINYSNKTNGQKRNGDPIGAFTSTPGPAGGRPDLSIM